MAQTVKEKLRTDIAIGITGTTGNIDPNNADSVRGEVYFCILIDDKIYDYKLEENVAKMTRHEIKQMYADRVFEALSELI